MPDFLRPRGRAPGETDGPKGGAEPERLHIHGNHAGDKPSPSCTGNVWATPSAPNRCLRPMNRWRRSGLRNDLLIVRSEEHTSELQSLMRISYACFCLKKTKIKI